MNATDLTAIRDYAKTLEMNIKYNKQRGLFKKIEDPYVLEMKMQIEEQKRNMIISDIHEKMKTGGELTKKELDYLCKHEPFLYDKAMKIQLERDTYKQQLKSARSKEGVQRIQQTRMSLYAIEKKALESSKLSKEEMAEKSAFLGMRMNAILDEYSKFISSNEYQQLPDKLYENRSNRNVKQHEQNEHKRDEKKKTEPVDIWVNYVIQRYSIQEIYHESLEKYSTQYLRQLPDILQHRCSGGD